MKLFLIIMVTFTAAMVNVAAAAATSHITTSDVGKIELVSVELAHALNNPDIMPYDRFNPDEKLIKINFKSSTDLLSFAHVHNRMVGFGIAATLCDRKMQYEQKQYPITILDGSELYQYGINITDETFAFLTAKFSDAGDRRSADVIFESNKRRRQIYYLYIRLHSIKGPSEVSYNLEKAPEDVCLKLGTNRLEADAGNWRPVDPIDSNIIRISKEAIAEALKRD